MTCHHPRSVRTIKFKLLQTTKYNKIFIFTDAGNKIKRKTGGKILHFFTAQKDLLLLKNYISKVL